MKKENVLMEIFLLSTLFTIISISISSSVLSELQKKRVYDSFEVTVVGKSVIHGHDGFINKKYITVVCTEENEEIEVESYDLYHNCTEGDRIHIRLCRVYKNGKLLKSYPEEFTTFS